jgi:hypothetical protein
MSQPIVPNKVKSIPMTQADTFEMRWLPKYKEPKYVRTIPIKITKKEIENVDVNEVDAREVTIAPPEQNVIVPNARESGHFVPRNKPRIRVATREQRTCIRHDMRTVYYGKHRWRCRR